MIQGNNSYIMNNKNVKPQEIVNIPVSLYESIQGQYFVGQTKMLRVNKDYNAWAGLINPCNSSVNLYTNVFTISNFSEENLVVQIWLNANNPLHWCISHKTSPTNTALNPPIKNKVDIRFVPSTTEVPQDGINVYERIVSPNTTLVAEEDGKFIEAPGGNYVLVVKSSNSNFSNVVAAFGWWEKPKCH